MDGRSAAGDWRTLTPPAHVHLVGIGGAGMSGLARMLRALGYTVTGCDRAASPELDRLQAEGIQVELGHHPAHVHNAAFLVLSAAVSTSEPEIGAAIQRRLPVVKRAAVLGWLSEHRQCIAVAGAHGKSTTSGMIAWILTQAGYHPSFAVGADLRDLGVNARIDTGEAFVVEADEYDYSFLLLRPSIAVVLNIEHDHPDLFPTPAHVERAFQRFLEAVPPGGTAVVAADDPAVQRVLTWLAPRQLQIITFGANPKADWWVEPGDPPQLHGPHNQHWPLHLSIPGWHNRLNAAAAVAAAHAAGVSVPQSLRALAAFHGVSRRFEQWGEVGDIKIFVDYAHHPSEIAATIAAARERFPGCRLWVLFQPHTYTRTRAFLDRFAEVLELADGVVLVPIYAAREADPGIVQSADIGARIQGVPVVVADALDDAVRRLVSQLHGDEVILILGAGDVWRAAPALIQALEGHA